MPGFSILKIFTLFGIVSTWSEKALADGKITLTEAAELAEDLGPLLGVPVDVQIPGLLNPLDELLEQDITESGETETGDEQPPDETQPPGPDRSNLV